MSDDDLKEPIKTSHYADNYEMPTMFLTQALLAIAALQELADAGRHDFNMTEWIEDVLECSNSRIATALFDLEMRLERRIDLWPLDPTDPRGLLIRQAVEGMKAKFKETGLAIDGPDNSVIKPI